MSSLFNTAKIAIPAGGRPPSAVDLTPEGVLAATLPGPGSAPVYAFAALPAGALVAGVEGANLRQPDVVAAAIRTALDEVSPRKRAVTLVLPDTLVRVFVLDFDTLPAKPAEAVPVLRFRLRKMVPFDVEPAAVSYQRLPQNGNPDTLRVLATIMPGPILAEYEAAVRAAGYEPGAVLPSSLAALSAEESMEPLLTANLSSSALTTSITSGDDLLLFRTVELPETAAARVAEVQRSVAVAAAYYEDKLGAPARRLHYTGAVDVHEFVRALGDAELEVVEMAPVPATGAATPLGPVGFAGVTGALAGVA